MGAVDFYEPDQSVSKIIDAFERGGKGRTREPVPSTLEFYRDARGRYRWRLKDTGGRIVASSGRAYRSRREALDAVEQVRGMLTADTLIDAS